MISVRNNNNNNSFQSTVNNSSVMKSYSKHEQGGCLCFSCRCLVMFSATVSLVTSLACVLVSIYLVINTQAYQWCSDSIKQWLRENRKDKEVVDIAVSYFDIFDVHHRPIMFGVITALVIHLLVSLLLILGAMLHKHLLLIPWMVTDLIIITCTFLLFSLWSFLSFFVGLMAAIIFPFFSGLILGVKIMLWRQVMTLYTLQMQVLSFNKEYEELKTHEAMVGARRKISTISEEANNDR